MHDPMSVVFSILRPWPQRASAMGERRHEPDGRYRHRQVGPLNIRARRFRCSHCDGGKVRDPVPSYQPDAWPGMDCPDCLGRGFNVVPHRRRPYFGWHFWRFGSRTIYWPPLITVWHVDRNIGGDDDSCLRPAQRRLREAKKDGDGLGAAYWSWRWRHVTLFHVHHWKLQVIPWQRLQRWRKVRCEGCGERFGWSESGMADGWDSPLLWHMGCYEQRQPMPDEAVAAAVDALPDVPPDRFVD